MIDRSKYHILWTIKSLQSISRTCPKMYNQAERNIHKLHWSVSRRNNQLLEKGANDSPENTVMLFQPGSLNKEEVKIFGNVEKHRSRSSLDTSV